MRIVAVDYRIVRWPMSPRGAARGRGVRTAVIVAVRDESGITGLGEAAPLPGMSIDNIGDAVRACEALAARVPFTLDVPAHATAIADRITPAPAARFAIETALIVALAQRMHTNVASLLAPIPQAELQSAVVVDDEAEATAALELGARCLKIKAPSPADLERVRRIARAVPGTPLRIDANRGWPREHTRALLATLADLAIDYVEEPCMDAHMLLGPRPCASEQPSGMRERDSSLDMGGALPVRIALDESLIHLAPDELARALESPDLAALVLKPTLLGGFARCLELAAAAHAQGIAPVITHTLEGPVGTAAAYELARAVGADVFVGLGPHPALPLAATAAVVSRASRAEAIVATHDADTIGAIHAALSARRPIALLHAKAPADELARQRRLVEEAQLEPDDAVILFTSGSTGPSRGVVLSRAAIEAAAEASAAHLGWRDDDCWLVTLPLAHAGGLSIIVRCWLANKAFLLDDLAGIERATLASLVPTQLAELLDDPQWRPPSQLRAVLLGGAACPPSLLAAATARGVPVLPTYGLTETFGQVATARVPGGKPVPLRGVQLIAGTRDAPATIRIRGPMLASRYLDGTPIEPELATADLGYVAGGELHVVGRADDVIITGGENVHPTQVEAVLAATPGVRAAAAFGVADARWGQIVAAAIAIDARFDETRALAAWHAQLPPHARPRRLGTFPELPRLPSGKIDRRRVASLPATPIQYAGDGTREHLVPSESAWHKPRA